jgi:hypothetical protein
MYFFSLNFGRIFVNFVLFDGDPKFSKNKTKKEIPIPGHDYTTWKSIQLGHMVALRRSGAQHKQTEPQCGDSFDVCVGGGGGG